MGSPDNSKATRQPAPAEDAATAAGGPRPAGGARTKRVRESGAEGGLKQGNVWIAGERTSLRLEKAMWTALEDIAVRHDTSIHEICTLIEQERLSAYAGASLSGRVRTFMVEFYRRAATEEGFVHASRWLEETYGRPPKAPLRGKPGRRKKVRPEAG